MLYFIGSLVIIILIGIVLITNIIDTLNEQKRINQTLFEQMIDLHKEFNNINEGFCKDIEIIESQIKSINERIKTD